MDLFEIIVIIVIHWFADFVLQTDKQAKGKSKEFKWLIKHTLTYSFVFYGIFCFYSIYYVLDLNILLLGTKFFFITFIAHTITDYFTSRINAKLWDKGKVHEFFVSVGFDQVLHYIQLFATYYWLFKN